MSATLEKPVSITSSARSSAAQLVNFNRYCTLQNPTNANYLSWQSGGFGDADQAIIYPTAKDLWFTDPSNTDSDGQIVTGAPIYIVMSAVVHLWLGSGGPESEFAQWANLGGEDIEYEWKLYVDANLTPNLPIALGQQPLYIASVAYPGYFLQQTPNAAYVTIGQTPVAWGMEPEGGE